MTSEVLSSINNLANELTQAKSSLKDYDENIKRLLGRDPSDPSPRNIKRPPPNDEFRNNRFQDSFRNRRNYDEEPPSKKRSMDSSVFKRLDKPRQNEEEVQKQVHSRVIVTPREVPSRQDALKAQDRDEKSKARNRRMFGALLGTLQKFRQEETKLKTKEEKRAQVEKKLEEQEVLEKAKVKKERHELFLGRKKKQQEIRILEQKMNRIKEHAFWEERQRQLKNFIRTTAKPCIYYLPRKLTPAVEEQLEASRTTIEKEIQTKKEELEQELESIENKFKKEKENLEDGEIDETDEIHELLNEELDNSVVVVKNEKVKEDEPKEESFENISLDDIEMPPEPVKSEVLDSVNPVKNDLAN